MSAIHFALFQTQLPVNNSRHAPYTPNNSLATHHTLRSHKSLHAAAYTATLHSYAPTPYPANSIHPQLLLLPALLLLLPTLLHSTPFNSLRYDSLHR